MARKYKMPEGMTSISINGIECKADKKGIVDVPDDANDEQLRSHGLVGVESSAVTPVATPAE